jgi:transposase
MALLDSTQAAEERRDAEAIAEAATRPTMRFVGLKREEQLAYGCQRLRPARQETLIASRAVPWLT